jgi:hypothetical protein
MPLRKRQRKGRAGGQVVDLQVYGCAGESCRACPLRAECARNPEKVRTITRQAGEERLEEHRVRMESAEAKGLRRRRGSVVERIFGDTKQHRQVRRFHGRGWNNARAEAGLMMLAFNAMTWQRLAARAASPWKSAG